MFSQCGACELDNPSQSQLLLACFRLYNDIEVVRRHCWGPLERLPDFTQRCSPSAAGHTDNEEEDEEDEELDLDDPDLLNDQEEGDSDENLEDADDLDAEDGPDQVQGDQDDEGMGIFRQALHQSSRPAAEGAAAPAGGLLDEEAAADIDRTAGMSKHERQQLRMQERIAKLEAQNMAEKDWFMQGEAGAGSATLPLAAY